MYSNLKKEISKNNIQLLHENLNDNILGSYYGIDDFHVIVINSKILNNKKLYNSTLAEELGHYHTSVPSYSIQNESLTISEGNHLKSENLALKWATEFMMPNKILLDSINSKKINISELSNEFKVTEDFVMLKFYHMSLLKNTYSIDSKRYLVLSSYPSIYIFENFERSEDNGFSYQAW